MFVGVFYFKELIILNINNPHYLSRQKTGQIGEALVIKELAERGYSVMDMNEYNPLSSFDLLVDKRIRIDVKTARENNDGIASYNISNKPELGCLESDICIRLLNGRTRKIYEKTCDFLVFVMIGRQRNYFWIIPPYRLKVNCQSLGINPHSINGKYRHYQDKWDFIESWNGTISTEIQNIVSVEQLSLF